MGIDLKKEIKLSDLFKRKGPTEPRAEKAPKAPRAKAPKVPRHDHEPSHDVPLMRAFNLLPKEDPREARSARPRAAQIVLAFVGVVLVAGLGAA